MTHQEAEALSNSNDFALLRKSLKDHMQFSQNQILELHDELKRAWERPSREELHLANMEIATQKTKLEYWKTEAEKAREKATEFEAELKERRAEQAPITAAEENPTVETLAAMIFAIYFPGREYSEQNEPVRERFCDMVIAVLKAVKLAELRERAEQAEAEAEDLRCESSILPELRQAFGLQAGKSLTKHCEFVMQAITETPAINELATLRKRVEELEPRNAEQGKMITRSSEENAELRKRVFELEEQLKFAKESYDGQREYSAKICENRNLWRDKSERQRVALANINRTVENKNAEIAKLRGEVQRREWTDADVEELAKVIEEACWGDNNSWCDVARAALAWFDKQGITPKIDDADSKAAKPMHHITPETVFRAIWPCHNMESYQTNEYPEWNAARALCGVIREFYDNQH